MTDRPPAMTTDEILAAFRCGLSKMVVDDDGLIDDTDPTGAATMWHLAKQLCRRLGDGTPYELALHRLVTLTAALICGQRLGIERDNLGRDWLIARAEVLQLQIPAV